MLLRDLYLPQFLLKTKDDPIYTRWDSHHPSEVYIGLLDLPIRDREPEYTLAKYVRVEFLSFILAPVILLFYCFYLT